MDAAARPRPTRRVGATDPDEGAQGTEPRARALGANPHTPPTDLELELHLFAQEWIRDQARARWAKHESGGGGAPPNTADQHTPTAAPSPHTTERAQSTAPVFEPPAELDTETSTKAPKLSALRAPLIRRTRRLVVAGAFISVVVASAAALICLALSQERPTWWRPVDSTDPKVIAVAERLENGVATLITQARPPNTTGDPTKPWTVALPASDANAWLNARLRKWLETQRGVDFAWPDDLLELQVEFADNHIHVGARIRQGDGQQVLTATITPEFRADGTIWMPAEWVSIGRLRIPAKWMLPTPDPANAKPHTRPAALQPDHAVGLGDLPHTREVLAALAGATPALMDPTIKLGDGRRVRLLALSAKDGRLLITCRTETREPPKPPR